MWPLITGMGWLALFLFVLFFWAIPEAREVNYERVGTVPAGSDEDRSAG